MRGGRSLRVPYGVPKASARDAMQGEVHKKGLDYGLRDSDGNDLGGAVWDTRVVGTRTLETRRRLDEHDILFNAVPDLRAVVQALILSGRVPKFTSE
jgi:hypothetical protein